MISLDLALTLIKFHILLIGTTSLLLFTEITSLFWKQDMLVKTANEQLCHQRKLTLLFCDKSSQSIYLGTIESVQVANGCLEQEVKPLPKREKQRLTKGEGMVWIASPLSIYGKILIDKIGWYISIIKSNEIKIYHHA